MSLGAAKTAMGSSVVTPADYSVFISPSSMSVTSSNGGNSTPLANSNIIGGVGPFTYLWVSDNVNVFVNTETEASTKFVAGGFDNEVSAIVTLTVTDTGNANAETENTIDVTFLFGDQT